MMQRASSQTALTGTQSPTPAAPVDAPPPPARAAARRRRRAEAAPRSAARLFARQFVLTLLAFLMCGQSSLALAADAGRRAGTLRPVGVALGIDAAAASAFEYLASFFTPAPPEPVITDAAVSRNRPSLNGGSIEGSLRVMKGETFGINTPFQLTGDLYTVGTSNIILNSGATHGGLVDDGGAAAPSGYPITFNSNLHLSGKIHRRADALPLPSVPASVPAAGGTRTVNLNSATNVAAQIGNWATVKDLNVTPGGLVIDVPPGNYGTFTLNGNSRLNFTAGTYNFAGTVNLNAGANIQTTGKVVVNIGQSFNLNQGSFVAGPNTLPGDVVMNVLGTSFNINSNCLITAQVRAYNANVNFNGTNPIIHGQVIAGWLNMNGGKITGNTSVTPPPDTSAPAVAITSPTHNATTFDASINVTGTAADPGQFQSGIASVTVNGAPAAYNPAAGTWAISNVALSVGPNTITARATDAAGNASPAVVITVTRQPAPLDTVAPTLAITSPAGGATVEAEKVTVTGTVSDAGTPTSGVASVTVNGVPAALNTQAGTWVLADLPLGVGPNVITARAADAAGNVSADVVVNVTRRDPTDTQRPLVSITSPAEGATTYDAAVAITGTASDAGQHQTGVRQVFVNDQPAQFDPATGQWSLQNFQLALGPNTITARAVDGANNQATAVVNLTRRPPPDETDPALEVLAPADNSSTEAATVAVSGTVSDAGEHASGVASVTVNGTPAAYDPAAGTWTLAGFALALGQNEITVRALDRANNDSTKVVRVTRVRPPDTNAPALAVTAPAGGATVTEETVTVSGTAADDGPNDTGVKSVTVNGQPAEYDSGTRRWSVSGIRLVEGPNVLTVAALDNAEPTPNRRELTHTVTLKTPDRHDPVVTILSPSAADTYASTVTVTGTATDEGLNATGVKKVTVNGREATYNATTKQWAVNGVQLSYGENTIVAVATDGADPAHEGRAELRVTRLRVPPPVLTITNPANGSVHSTPGVTVAGEVSTISTDPVAVTVNGQPAAVNGGRFTKVLTLANGPTVITVVATDSLNQTTQTSVSVIRDDTAPSVAFSFVPASVQPGGTYQVFVEASDDLGIAEVEFRVDGARVASSATAPYQFTLNVPSVLAAGQVITLSAVARDLSGATSSATAQTRTAGPGGVSGYVFDDATGYPLEGALADLGTGTPAPTDAAGTYSLVAAQPVGTVRLTKEGYTFVERRFTVTPGEGAALFDARLTPLDARANQLGANGGAAFGDAERLRLDVDAGVFSSGADVRLTAVSPQGIANLLPFGWSPVPGGVVEVRAGGSTTAVFPTPARLRVARTPFPLAGLALVLARYDESARGWKVLAEGLAAAADGSLEATVPGAGQYAFLVADTGATAPPPVAAGAPLPSSRPAESAALDAATATAAASPRVTAYSADARATISFIATAPTQLPSGVAVEASFGETYTLLGGKDSVLVDRTQQDFVLYAFPEATVAQPNRLGASFVAKPTRTDFSLNELLGANVHVDIRSGREAKTGVLVGADGGVLTSVNGAQFTIPAGALSGSQPVFFSDLAAQDLGLSLPEGYEVVGGFDVNLSGATLTAAGSISTTADAGDASRLVVARLVSFGGVRALKVVARAAAVDGRFVSMVAGPSVPAGVALAGVTATGRYVFVRVPHAFGYAKGVVSDGGAPAAAVRVSNDRTPFADLTGADGRFVVVGHAEGGVANQLSAVATATDATGRASAALAAQDAVADAPVALQSAPLAVESVTPADGAPNMIVTTPVTVTFNKPVASQTLTASTLKLQTAAGNPVLGQITVAAGGRAAVFTPSNTLAGSTAYRVSLTQGVRDVYGKPLAAAFTSTFTTSEVVRADDRLKPEKIRIDYPDASGVSKVNIAARAVPEGSSIIAVNEASGSTVTTVAGTGAVVLEIVAQVGDEVTLIIRQPDGTEYRVTQAAYRRPDGVTSVGANGGTVLSDDGKMLLEVPRGAIVGQADLKMEPRTLADVTTPRVGEMSPENATHAAGVKLTVQGEFRNEKELHLEVAVPAGANVQEGQRVAFMKPTKIFRDGQEYEAWETVTSGRVEGGRFKTTSPPFLGLFVNQPSIAGQMLNFLYVDVFVPRQFRAVHGVVIEKVPGGAPKPLEGVKCEIRNVTAPVTSGWPYTVSTTGSTGGFGTFEWGIAAGTTVAVRCTDQRGRTADAFAAPWFNSRPDLYQGINGITSLFASVEFPPADEGGPETKPAVLRMGARRLDVEEGETDSLAEEGIVSVGTQVAVFVDNSPQVATFSGRLLANGVEGQTLEWQVQGTPSDDPGGQRRVAVFRVPAQGSYTVEVETYTMRGAPATRARVTYNFIGLTNPNMRPPLPGPPRVLAVTPPNGARQVDAGRRIHLEFSEPVKNLVAGTTVYLRETATDRRLGGRLFSGGVAIGADSENISQLDFEPEGGLAGGREYEVHVTAEVRDTDGHALDQEHVSPEDTSPQPFKSSFTTFAGIVLTDAPLIDGGHRIAAAGQYAATIKAGLGSQMIVYDMSNPSLPTVVGKSFVFDYAIAIAMVEIEDPEHNFKVGVPRNEYSRVAVVTTVPLSDPLRSVNLIVFNLDDPAKPEMIGIASLSFPSNLTAVPNNVVIHDKRAYITATPQGGAYAVDIEQVINQFAVGMKNFPSPSARNPVTLAIKPRGGFAGEAKKQTVTYGNAASLTSSGSAALSSISTITQVISDPEYGLQRAPVAYVTAPNKSDLYAFAYAEVNDNRNGMSDFDGDGLDDRVVIRKPLEPAAFPREVQARTVKIKGRDTDLAVVLGYNRLWLFDVTDTAAPRQYPSKSFAEMGFGDELGYAVRMDVEETLAYIIFPNHIGVVDFSDPANPARVATIASAGAGMKWVAVKDGFIYTLSNDGVHVSIARPASQVIVYGLNRGDDRICTNPVVITRQNRMAQPAGVYFQVFGSGMPQAAQVVIRRERQVGAQHVEEELATLPAQIDAGLSSDKVVVGRAVWDWPGAVEREWTYTAEVLFDPGSDTEFHGRREPVPFSYLIAEAMTSFGSSGGKGFYNYVLGGNANVTLTVEGRNILEDANDPHVRTYGLNADLVKHELEDGVYPFTLRAALEGNPSVSDEISGEMTVANTPRDVRLPGHTVVSGVELQNGNLGLSYTDVEIKNRGLSLSLTRSYNTAAANSFGPLGYGWSHNLQVLLVHDRQRQSYTMRGGDGGGQLFLESKASGGKIEAEDPHQGTLVRNTDGSFDYLTKYQTRYHFPGAMEEDDTNYFNLAYMGNLQYMEEPNGNRLTLTYDAQGRMTRVTDSSNRALDFTYEQANTPLVGVIAPTGSAISCTNRGQFGLVRRRFLRAEVGKAWRIKQVKGPGGLKLDYTYDTDYGNLVRVERAGEDTISRAVAVGGENVWEYAYHEPGQGGAGAQRVHLMKTVTEPGGAPRTTAYDYHFDQFRTPVSTVIFGGGMVTNRFTYTRESNLVTQAVFTDGRGHTTTYSFDREARKTTSTAPRGATTVTVFNEKGQPSSITDAGGAVTTITYERDNAVSRTVTGGGATAATSTRYDPTFNKPVSVTDANGQTTTYALDGRGNVTLVTLPTGRSVRMSYAANGDVESTTDEYGSRTSFTYDAYGNTARVERAGGLVTTRAHDVRSRLTSSSGTVEPSAEITYDALDRVVRRVTTDPGGVRESLTESFEYLAGGQMTKSSSASGGQSVEVTNVYDALDRVKLLTETVSGAGTFSHAFTYDGNSNLLTEEDRRGVKRTYAYDDLNYRTSTTVSGPFGGQKTVSESEVNLFGQPVSIRDMYGKSVTLGYDGLHRLNRRELPGGRVEQMTYDGVGNVLTVTDFSGRVTTTSYDAVNRPVERSEPLGRVTTWVYDDANHSVTEERAPQGLSITTRLDALDRPLSRRVRFSGGDYTASYSYSGLSVAVTDPRGVVTTHKVSAFGETGEMTVAGADPGYSVQASYNGFGGLKSNKDALGRPTAYTLDGLNRPLTAALPGGASEVFKYDGEGNLVEHTNRRGVRTERSFDNLGRILSAKIVGDGDTVNVLNIDYDDAAGTETHRDARGKPTTYRFDEQRRLVGVTNAASQNRTLEYDGDHLVRESDFRGAFTSYEYDGADRPTQITDREGNVTTISHSDAQGYTKSVTDRRGQKTVESYDALGRLTSVTRGGETVYTFQYDAGSNMTARTDGRNNRSAYTYDALGRVRTASHSGGQTETFSYDAVGNLLEHSDGTGGPTRRTYDDLDHLLTITDGANNTTRFRHDAGGLLLERTEPKGGAHRTAYQYNALGSLVRVTDGASGVWELGYDAAQNLTSVKDARQKSITYVYDDLNRVEQVLQPLGVSTRMGYDANGNLTSRTDPKGQTTSVVYDRLDRARTVTYGNGLHGGPLGYEYGYDPEGNVTEIAETLPTADFGDVPGGTRRYARTYDARGRLASSTDPYGHRVSYAYDAADNVTRFTDAANRQTTFQYDQRNRLAGVTLPGGSSVAYDRRADGLVNSVSYGTGMTRAFAYDGADRLTRVTNTLGGAGQTEEYSYTYDANSNRESETKKFNGSVFRSVNYGYDALDRLTRVDTAATAPIAVTTEGLRAEYFDDADLTNLKVTRTDPQLDFAWAGAASPDASIDGESFSARWSGHVTPQHSEEYTFYTRSDEGVRLWVNGELLVDQWNAHTPAEHSGRITLQAGQRYDIKVEFYEGTGDAEMRLFWSSASQPKEVIPSSRLGWTASTNGQPSTLAYAYDAVGNRLSETGRAVDGTAVNRGYVYDDLNRLTSATGYGPAEVTYAYDDNGNMTEVRQGGQLSAKYEYDVRDQLRRVRGALSQEIASYDYDSDRRRIGRRLAGLGETRYAYNGTQVTNEFDGFDRALAHYDYGEDLLRAEFAQEGARYYFADGQGSVTALAGVANGSASAAARYEYDAWGESLGASGGSANAVGYTGQRRDPETGLMPLGAGERYYSPQLGRFTQQDSWTGVAETAQTLNRYAYSLSNPLRYTDPSGNQPEGSGGQRPPTYLQMRHQLDGDKPSKGIIKLDTTGAGEPQLVVIDMSTAPVATTPQETVAQRTIATTPVYGPSDGPRNYLRDPMPPENWVVNGLSNTLSDLLGLDFVADASWTIGDHRRPMSERLGAAVKLAGHVVLTAAGGPVFKLAGKAIGFGVRGVVSAGRLVVRGVRAAARVTGRVASKGWGAARQSVGRLLAGGADDAARALNLSDDVGRVASKADDAGRAAGLGAGEAKPFLMKNVRAEAWADDFGKAGEGYARLVKDLPKWDPMRTKFARMLREVRASGGAVRQADMGSTLATFGGESLETGVWFRWNPNRLRVVDMLEETVHWQQLKAGLPKAGYSPEALEIMAKRSVINSYDISRGLKFELLDDIRRVRQGQYVPKY